jgi:hypothetical protein
VHVPLVPFLAGTYLAVDHPLCLITQERAHAAGVALLGNAQVGNLEAAKDCLLLVAADQVKDEVCVTCFTLATCPFNTRNRSTIGIAFNVSGGSVDAVNIEVVA